MSDEERAADMSLLQQLGVSVDTAPSSSHADTKPSAASVIVKPLTNKSSSDDDDGVSDFYLCLCIHNAVMDLKLTNGAQTGPVLSQLGPLKLNRCQITLFGLSSLLRKTYGDR